MLFRSQAIRNTDGIPHCYCGGIIKPDLLLYGESLSGEIVSRTVSSLQHADLLVVCGSYLLFKPLEYLLQFYSGDEIIINERESNLDHSASCSLIGPLDKTFETLFANYK